MNIKINKTLIMIAILVFVFVAGSITLTLQLVSRQNSTAQLVHERIYLTNYRNRIIQEAIQTNCIRLNQKFGRLIPLQEAGKVNLLPGPHQLSYYRAHPKEAKAQLKAIDNVIKVLQPDPCNIVLIGKNPHSQTKK